MHSKPPSRFAPLLQIDDSVNERLMVRRAIEATGTPLIFNGVECMESALPFFERYPLPSIVLLDFDMGQHTGIDFLLWLREYKKIISVPVVMFTGSDAKKHLAECYAKGANYFINKPQTFERLKEIVRAIYQSLVTGEPHAITLLPEFQPDPRDHLKLSKAHG